MKTTLLIAACSVAVLSGFNSEHKSTTAAANNNKSITKETDKSDWVSLFDGKTTSGWHNYGQATAGDRWKVADGVLYLDTTVKTKWKIAGGGNLVTNNEYENFHLKLEWKIAPNGNSGILFYVNENTAKFEEPYETGPEMQVLDNDGHPDGKLFRHRAGDLYDLINCSKETVKPVGEWNQAEIICNKGKLDLILNGTTVVSTTMWDDNWNKMLAKSKFKEWPGFGSFKKGKICLQDHGNMVSFRNIKMKEL